MSAFRSVAYRAAMIAGAVLLVVAAAAFVLRSRRGRRDGPSRSIRAALRHTSAEGDAFLARLLAGATRR